MLGCCFGVLPTWLVERANPDWRLVSWLLSLDPSSTVNGILFDDDQVLERLRGRFFIGELKM
jgi:hypothetical protein